MIKGCAGIFIRNKFNGCCCDGSVQPIAAFDYSISNFLTNEYTFSNNSQNATSYQWDFGDGNTSTDENPVYNYAPSVNDEIYTVTLTATDDAGNESIITVDITVYADSPPIASFDVYHNGNSGLDFYPAQQDLTFDDTSIDDRSIVSVSWDFGDGSTSTRLEPIHSYTSAGSYDVLLTVVDSTGQVATKSLTLEVKIDEPYLLHYVLHDTSNFKLLDGSAWSDYDQNIRAVVSQPDPYDNQTIDMTVGSDFYRYGLFNTGLYVYDNSLAGASDGTLLIAPFSQAYIDNSSLIEARYEPSDMVLAVKYQKDPVGSAELTAFSEGFDVIGVSVNQIKFRLRYNAFEQRFELEINSDTQNSSFNQDYNIVDHGGVIPRDSKGYTYLFLQFSDTDTFKIKFGYDGNFVEIDTGFVAPPYENYRYGIGRNTDKNSHKHFIKYGSSLTANSQQELITLMQTDTTPDLSVINPIDFTWDFTDPTKMFSNPDGTGINPATTGDIVRWVENEQRSDDKYALTCSNTTNGYKYLFNQQGLAGVTQISNNVLVNMTISDYLDLGRTGPDGIRNGVETYPLGKIHMFKVSQDDGNFIRSGLGNFNGGNFSFSAAGGQSNKVSVFSDKIRITLNDDPRYDRISNGTTPTTAIIDIPVNTPGAFLPSGNLDKIMILQRVGFPVIVWVNDYKLTTDFALQSATNDGDKCRITQAGAGNVSSLETEAILHKHRIIKNAVFTEQELQTIWDDF